MSDLWVWRYFLEAGGGLNARTQRRVYEGALVRMGDNGGDVEGFGCVHPWPELGDLSLDECLADLAGDAESGLVRRTLSCVAADGAARAAGRSLFEGLEVPRSHATLPFFDEAAVAEAVGRGFTHVKVKVGREVRGELAEVRRCMARWPELRWRLDFNEMGEAGELAEIFGGWSDEERGAVDFLEDPVRYEGGDWQWLRGECGLAGLAFANDRHVGEERGDSDVLVVKPAVQGMPGGDGRLVVTSYLDHPLGQVFAAWEAARAGVTEVCGLQTHGVFGRCEFGEVLGEVGPEFGVPGGAGLGFGDLLEGLAWEKFC